MYAHTCTNSHDDIVCVCVYVVRCVCVFVYVCCVVFVFAYICIKKPSQHRIQKCKCKLATKFKNFTLTLSQAHTTTPKHGFRFHYNLKHAIETLARTTDLAPVTRQASHVSPCLLAAKRAWKRNRAVSRCETVKNMRA